MEHAIDSTIAWFLIVGSLLIAMGLAESFLRNLPLSPAMFYLPVGWALGPAGIGLLTLDPQKQAGLLTVLAGIALLISLFTVGLRLRTTLSDRLWALPIRLGTLAMVVTVLMVAAAAKWWLHMPMGAAILLGAILAPTDPILASDVQIKDTGDRDRIRFSLSGEGGLNDGSAYPFAMLGLALLGVPEAAVYAGPLAALRIAWAIAAGIAAGALLGGAIGALVVRLRRDHRLALGMEEFLTLGLIALSYGAAQLIGGIGFISVFASGVAVRRIEYAASGPAPPAEVIGPLQPTPEAEAEAATDPKKATAYMTEAVLGFNLQLEHIAEFTMVLLLGVMLSTTGFSWEGALLAAWLFLAVRPTAVYLCLLRTRTTTLQRRLMAWFGIRGIGSLYYLVFALQYDWVPSLKERFAPIVLTVVAISIVAHGISSTPLMELYARRRARG